MITRRLPLARPLFTHSLRPAASRIPFHQIRCASQAGLDPDVTDPDMNGGYINPPHQKRALRDPYGDWWDKQERRNFGEPLHEDNDVLGVFTTEPYTHMAPGKAALHLGVYVLAVLGLCGTVYQFYPDRPSAPKQYPGGLEAELGGPRTVIAPREGDEAV